MKHIYLFNENSRAAVYGIGTYIRELGDCLKEQEDISLHIVQLLSDEKEYKVIESNGYKTHYFPSPYVLYTSKTPLYYRNVWYILSQHIQLSESDQLIFHLNYYQEYSFIEIAKEENPACKIIYTIHYQEWCFKINGNISYFKKILYEVDTPLSEAEKKIIALYETEKKMLQKVDRIICLARFTQNLLIEEYEIPREFFFLISNGLKDEAVILSEEGKIQLKEQLYFLKKEKIILFVGRLDEIKGLDFLILSFKQIIKKKSNCRLVVIGDGDFYIYLKKSIDYWNKITFIGHLEKEKLYKFYQVADVGVLPSFHEQCSYVAIEMLMFGIPLIVVDTTGGAESVIDNNTGFVVPVLPEGNILSIDINLLTNKILSLLKKDFRQNARINYLEKYNSALFKENMLTCYNGMLNEK